MAIIVEQLNSKECIGCSKKHYCWILRSQRAFYLHEKCQCLTCLVKPMCMNTCEERMNLYDSTKKQ
jgi:hypothetical protein